MKGQIFAIFEIHQSDVALTDSVCRNVQCNFGLTNA